MKALRLRSTFARPADATAYAAGDEISNSATAGSVVVASLDLMGFTRGKIYAAELDITAASGNVVTTASDMELLLFRYADAPAAVGDNVTNPIAAATRALAVAQFRFDDTGWTGPLGTVAAGTSQSQAVMASLVQPLATPVMQAPYYPGYFFDFTGLTNKSLVIVLRALAAWTPTAVVNTFGVTIDLEAE
eukprot:GHVR01126331.1.p1 GENE.GHVR01126331.1~~GHVR01126331.1.p1  ORF type:complete len:190 (-),score=24.89 GHVR01126331.1:324-893(-)